MTQSGHRSHFLIDSDCKLLLREYIREGLFIECLVRKYDDEIDRVLPDQLRIEWARRIA